MFNFDKIISLLGNELEQPKSFILPKIFKMNKQELDSYFNSQRHDGRNRIDIDQLSSLIFRLNLISKRPCFPLFINKLNGLLLGDGSITLGSAPKNSGNTINQNDSIGALGALQPSCIITLSCCYTNYTLMRHIQEYLGFGTVSFKASKRCRAFVRNPHGLLVYWRAPNREALILIVYILNSLESSNAITLWKRKLLSIIWHFNNPNTPYSNEYWDFTKGGSNATPKLINEPVLFLPKYKTLPYSSCDNYWPVFYYFRPRKRVHYNTKLVYRTVPISIINPYSTEFLYFSAGVLSAEMMLSIMPGDGRIIFSLPQSRAYRFLCALNLIFDCGNNIGIPNAKTRQRNETINEIFNYSYFQIKTTNRFNVSLVTYFCLKIGIWGRYRNKVHLIQNNFVAAFLGVAGRNGTTRLDWQRFQQILTIIQNMAQGNLLSSWIRQVQLQENNQNSSLISVQDYLTDKNNWIENRINSYNRTDNIPYFILNSTNCRFTADALKKQGINADNEFTPLDN